MSAGPGASRTAGLVNLAVGILILLVLIPLALKVEQAPPPTIAEFAPQVQQQLKEPPKDQAANIGRLGGAGGGGGQFGALPSPSPSPSISAGVGSGQSQAPRYHRCVGNPPRQTEDPQSPPCVPYWSGTNGGATAKGVSPSTITVVLETNEANAGGAAFEPSGSSPIMQYLVDFINDRFELYGRRIVLKYYDQNNGLGPEAQVAQEDQQFAPFAHWGSYRSQGPETVYWNDAFARHHIITSSVQYFDLPGQSQEHMNQHAPYEWMYLPSYDQIERNLGEMWCKGFKDRPPEYAGPDVTGSLKVRKLQVYLQPQSDPDHPAGSSPVDAKPLMAALAGCGATARVSPTAGNDVQKWQAAAIQARQNDITSVVCLCGATENGAYTYSAFSSEGYHPEWINTDIVGLDMDNFDQSGQGPTPSDQYPYVLGLESYNKTQALADMPWWWAVKEINPSFSYSGHQSDNWAYWALLLLASGIQQAGPNLTPQTFEQGLARTSFPNPGADGPPFYQARVGFGPGNHSMISSMAPVWFDVNASSYEFYGQAGGQNQGGQGGNTGAYCYLDRGIRYALGDWPARPLVFRQPPCR